MLSVLNPQTDTWSPARQVDLGLSRIGRYSRSVGVAITDNRTIYAVWSMSDPDFDDGDPPIGTWLSASTDFGMSCSPLIFDCAEQPNGLPLSRRER